MTVNDWIWKYKDNLNVTNRFQTMRMALEMLHKRSGTTILETGCVRMKDDWGAGMSTFVFGDYCKTFNANLYTVDISPQNIDLCKEVTQDFSEHIEYVVSDSLSYLSLFNEPIDLLYLDSMDCPLEDDPENPELIKSQEHQLKEMKEATKNIHPKTLILLDDNDFKNGGKTKLTKIWLKENGYENLLDGKQSLWTR